MIINNLPNRKIDQYRAIVGNEEIEKIMIISEELKNISITHVNSTAFGGGVAEILYSLVPLMNSIGIKTIWEVIEAPLEFFNVTKKIHNSLQGASIDLSKDEIELYLKVNEDNALNKLKLETTHVIVHDPQPLGIRKFLGNDRKWIWRCHIDLSKPHRSTWNFISRLLRGYHASIYHLKEYVHPEAPTKIKYIMPPSIDPLSDKNRELSWSEVERILNKFGVDPEKPIIIQVARFDPWKDPIGAIDTYRIVKRKIPNVQLLLIASMAHDDPEGWIYFEKTIRHAGEDPNIYFLTNLVGVGAKEVNAFQRASTVALQLSIREGFGLAVTEAMWKKKPIVARPSGGIKLQVIDGVNGYLVQNIEDAAEKIIHLIKNRDLRERMGENAYRHVLENFIITRHLEKYLNLFKILSKNSMT